VWVAVLGDLSGEKSNQIFDELANWEEVLKGSSLGTSTRSATTISTNAASTPRLSSAP
jgi:hypothetical protein